MPQNKLKKPTPKLKVIGLIPDCHFPNVSRKDWDLVVKVFKSLGVDIIAIMGDFADAETLSAHAATKPGQIDFEDELNSVKAALDELDALGATRKVYIEGNHEFRLDRYLMSQAPALFRSVRWQSLLDLKRRGWEWVPYRKSTRIGKLHLTHDTGSAGVNAHRTSAKAFGGSCVIGHTHRAAWEAVGRFGGKPYVAAMLGWLGDAESAGSYMHEAKASDWVHGFGVGFMEEDTGVVHLQPIVIVNGRCVVNGKLYS